jgi:hypothetical protein
MSTRPNAMTPNEADPIQSLREHSGDIARHVTAMHPLVRHLADDEARTAVIRALFELTKQVEVIKKQLLRLGKKDSSTLL